MRDIKFRLILKGKIVGYERLTQRGWEWMFLSLNPDSGERWTRGVIESSKYIRNQYTCFKDKNDKEIYEGDILKCKSGDIVTVVWSEKYSSFGITKIGWMYMHYFGEAVDSNDVEIIDNIHQNHELIQP